MFASRKKAAITAVAALALASAATLSACGEGQSKTVATANDESRANIAQNATASKVLEKVAASAYGHDITEQEVADYIAQFRFYVNATDDAAWATYLDQNKLAASDVRKQAIDELAKRYALDAKADEHGIKITDEEVDKAVKDSRELYGYADDDQGWADFLSSSYSDAKKYRDDVYYVLLRNKVAVEEIAYEEPSTPQLLTYANDNPDQYAGKKIRLLIYPSGYDYAAEKALDALMEDGKVSNAELLEYADAESQSGIDVELKEPQWTSIAPVSGTAQSLLAGLGVGQAGIYTDDNGLPVLIYVDEQYTTKRNGQFDLSAMPEPIMAKLKSDTVFDSRSKAIEQMMNNLILDESQVSINDMPSGLPYDVDMSLSSYGKAPTENLNTEEMVSNQIAEMENANSASGDQ